MSKAEMTAQIAGGTNLAFQNEGKVTLEVRQAGNANYSAAPTITNQMAMPNSAVIHIQNSAPGPPTAMAAATPAMFPVPMVADRAVIRAA